MKHHCFFLALMFLMSFIPAHGHYIESDMGTKEFPELLDIILQ